MPFPPGTAIAGRYLVERLVGEGRTGCVVVARDRQREQLVAVKFMHGRFESEAATWFLREARAVAQIDSEHVAKVLDSGVLGDGGLYVVTEYLEGMNLRAMLDKRPRLPVSLAASYAMQTSEGLAEAHALGIVHRDIKPSNLFLSRRSDGSIRVKLLDFGSSKGSFTHRRATDEGGSSVTLIEAPLYMAPEQLRSQGDVDRRADLWGLGVVLYEMLAGRSPFEAGTPAEITARVSAEFAPPLRTLRADVPAALEALVMQCLEKDPNHRFRNVAAFAQSLSVVGTPGARKAAERIGRLVLRPAGGPGSRSPAASAVVPSASLTDTRFGRAVEGIERIVRGAPVRPDAPAPVGAPLQPAPPFSPSSGAPPPFLQPSETLPPFASPAMVAPSRGLAKTVLRGGIAALGVAMAIFVASRLRIRAPGEVDTSRATASSATVSSLPPPAPASLPPAVDPMARWKPVAVPPAASVAPTAPLPGPASTPHPRPRRAPAHESTPASTAALTAAPVGTDGFGGRE
jgi:serine/threonine-protein kinase